MTAHSYKTAVKIIKESENQDHFKINEMNVTFEELEEQANIKAIRHKHLEKQIFQANNGFAYQQQSNGNNSSNSNNGATTIKVMPTNKPDHDLEHHANQTQHWARPALTARRRITSSKTVMKEK